MKHPIVFISLLIPFFITACSGTYQSGDMYKCDGRQCIVVSVNADGSPAMCVSLEEGEGMDAISAAVWAVLGEGWRLPTKEEIAVVRKYRSAINATLSKKGLPLLMENNTYYWTSTPCSESHTYACGPDGVRCYFSTNDGPAYRVRAVKIISN